MNVHVRNVEYIEYGCERFSGTLYMTIFRLVFAPDNEIEPNNLVRIFPYENKKVQEFSQTQQRFSLDIFRKQVHWGI